MQLMINKLKKHYEDKIKLLETTVDRAIADKQEAIAEKQAAIKIIEAFTQSHWIISSLMVTNERKIEFL